MLLIKKPAVLNRYLRPATGWCFFYLVITAAGLYNYINWASPVFLMGILCLFLVSLPGNSTVTSLRFAYITFALSVLSLVLPFRTILYLTGSSAILFVLEANYGKVRHAAVCTLVIMSPIFEYASTVFSFPIRLQLTSWAGSIMAFMGQKVLSAGNMLTIRGNEFTVDPACMGLNMMETSLLLGIMISSFYQEKFEVRLRFVTLILILTSISLLNVISNLFRIITLVQFNIQPSTFMHDVTGIVCLLVYVLAPGTVLIKFVIKNSGKLLVNNTQVSVGSSKPGGSTGLYFLVTGAIIFTVFHILKHETEKHSFCKITPLCSRVYGCTNRRRYPAVKKSCCIGLY